MIEEQKYGLPEGWHQECIGKVVLKSKQRDPRRFPDTSFRYVDVSCVSNESFRITETTSLQGRDAPSRARKEIRSDDVLFATVRPTLKRVAMVPEELDGQIASTGYCVLRSDKSKVDPRYLYAHLLTDGFIARMGRLERGAGYPAVRETDVFASPLPLPPLPEQQRIAQVLSTVQEAIAQQERLIRTTAELMQALMQKLFTEGLRGEALKETEIGRVPESWSMSIIGAEANVTKLAGYEYTKYIKYTDEGEIIAIRGVNLKDGKLDLSDVKRIWRDVSEELPRSQLHPGDVLLSYVGTVGSVAMVEDDGKYHLAPNVAKLTPKDDKRLIPEFLLAYLRTDIGRTDLFRSVSQTSQPVISMARIRSLHLPLPDVDEQASIVATLSVADRKLDNASRKRNALQDLFRTLLHELMTGKVRVGEID